MWLDKTQDINLLLKSISPDSVWVPAGEQDPVASSGGQGTGDRLPVLPTAQYCYSLGFQHSWKETHFLSVEAIKLDMIFMLRPLLRRNPYNYMMKLWEIKLRNYVKSSQIKSKFYKNTSLIVSFEGFSYAADPCWRTESFSLKNV